MPRPQFTSDFIEYFWSNVDWSGGPMACWHYRNTSPTEYGRILTLMDDGRRRRWKAHRVAYELVIGPIPDGMEVLHHCDNPPCCNPIHLAAGTHLENMIDCGKKGRRASFAGSANGNAKITEDDVRSIRKFYATGGYSYFELGNHFGVGKSTIHKIITGVAWRHVAS